MGARKWMKFTRSNDKWMKDYYSSDLARAKQYQYIWCNWSAHCENYHFAMGTPQSNLVDQHCNPDPDNPGGGHFRLRAHRILISSSSFFRPISIIQTIVECRQITKSALSKGWSVRDSVSIRPTAESSRANRIAHSQFESFRSASGLVQSKHYRHNWSDRQRRFLPSSLFHIHIKHSQIVFLIVFLLFSQQISPGSVDCSVTFDPIWIQVTYECPETGNTYFG